MRNTRISIMLALVLLCSPAAADDGSEPAAPEQDSTQTTQPDESAQTPSEESAPDSASPEPLDLNCYIREDNDGVPPVQPSPDIGRESVFIYVGTGTVGVGRHVSYSCLADDLARLLNV